MPSLRRALVVLAAASLLLLTPNASGSEPDNGTLDRTTAEVRWSGPVPAPTWTYGGRLPCVDAVPDPACERFDLTIGELGPAKRKKREPVLDDVLIGIGTPSVPPGQVVEIDLFVYGPDGDEVGRGVEVGSGDTVTLREPVAGTYAVVVRTVVSSDSTATYEGRARVIDAGPVVPVDEESVCGLDPAPEVREADQDAGIGAYALLGDPTFAIDGADRADRIVLDVLVYLDGVTVAEATEIFEGAAASYEPLNIELRPVELRTHTFVDGEGNKLTDGLAIIRETKRLVGGQRPEGVDIVEALVGHDIQQLGQNAIAGIADCIGGVAFDDRAFLVAEGHTLTDVPFGPLVFAPDANPHVTAHELGHLLGGQHHYANCVEGVEATDAHEDGTVEASPCTLMFNAADLLGAHFDTVNGTIVRGAASRHARP